MTLVRITGGRVAEVFFGIGCDGTAHICEQQHVLYSIPPDLPHLHVNFRAWSKGGHASTILDVSADRLRARMTLEEWETSGTSVLEFNGRPAQFAFILWPIPKGGAVPYAAGDKIPFELHMSRGWTKRTTVVVGA
jgi:hypothetical protein